MYCLDLPDVVSVSREHHLSKLLRGVADSECGLSNACVTAYMPHALQQTAHTMSAHLLCCAAHLAVQVMGGSGDYFADADTVIVMDNYTPSDQTAAAHSIAAQHVATLAAAGVQQPAPAAGGAAAVWVTPRAPLRVYAGPEDSRGVKTHVRGLHHIQVSRRSCCI